MNKKLPANTEQTELFESPDGSDYGQQTADMLNHVVAEITVDTAEITQEYMKRPGHMIGMTLGAWFCAAHRLTDKELARSSGSMATKLLILSRGYNKLPLEPLKAWNDRFNAQKSKYWKD